MQISDGDMPCDAPITSDAPHLSFVYQMGRLCGGAHEISGIKAPIFLCGWVSGSGMHGGGEGGGGSVGSGGVRVGRGGGGRMGSGGVGWVGVG